MVHPLQSFNNQTGHLSRVVWNQHCVNPGVWMNVDKGKFKDIITSTNSLSMVPIHLRTLFSSSATSILQEITALSSKYGNKGHTILFSLSTNFRKSEDLEAVFGKLVTFNTPRPNTSATAPQVQGYTLGCLVEPPTGIYHSQALAAYRRKQDYISCSIGVFDSANVIAFRSDLPSEEQPQVGRWHSFRKTSTAGSDIRLDQGGAPSPNGPVDWDNIWAQSSLQSNSSPELPHELQTTR